jgi:hypothetical protein
VASNQECLLIIIPYIARVVKKKQGQKMIDDGEEIIQNCLEQDVGTGTRRIPK